MHQLNLDSPAAAALDAAFHRGARRQHLFFDDSVDERLSELVRQRDASRQEGRESVLLVCHLAVDVPAHFGAE